MLNYRFWFVSLDAVSFVLGRDWIRGSRSLYSWGVERRRSRFLILCWIQLGLCQYNRSILYIALFFLSNSLAIEYVIRSLMGQTPAGISISFTIFSSISFTILCCRYYLYVCIFIFQVSPYPILPIFDTLSFSYSLSFFLFLSHPLSLHFIYYCVSNTLH